MKITKELFIEAIESIKNQVKIDRKCNKAFQTILPDDFITGYNTQLITDYIKFLQKITEDTCEWIEHYIWELDFGKKYETGCITDKHGEDIELKTPEDLWNIITIK